MNLIQMMARFPGLSLIFDLLVILICLLYLKMCSYLLERQKNDVITLISNLLYELSILWDHFTVLWIHIQWSFKSFMISGLSSKRIKQYEPFSNFLMGIRFQIYDSINYHVKYQLSSKEHNVDIDSVSDLKQPT